MKKPVKLCTVDYEIPLRLPNDKVEDAVKMINLHYFNDEQCNHMVKGEMVSKYPKIEAEHPEFLDAHCNIRRSQWKQIKIEIWSDGSLRFPNKG